MEIILKRVVFKDDKGKKYYSDLYDEGIVKLIKNSNVVDAIKKHIRTDKELTFDSTVDYKVPREMSEENLIKCLPFLKKGLKNKFILHRRVKPSNGITPEEQIKSFIIDEYINEDVEVWGSEDLTYDKNYNLVLSNNLINRIKRYV